jgi:predicted Zn-dependent protease
LGLTLTLVGLLLTGCGTVPYTGRSQLLMVSQDQELRLGYQAFEQLKYRSRPSPDPQMNEAVQRVGRQIARVADRPDFRWEFVVIDDPTPNAFCLPGGKVGVFAGLFRYLKSDADLATVMSHEAAHVLARHAGERLSQNMLAQMGGTGLNIAMAGMGAHPAAGQLAMMGYGLGTQMGLLLPYSRKQEYEADRIGLILMAKAGYDPGLGVDFWRRFATAKGDRARMPAFASTHPSDADRIRNLEAGLAEAQRYYTIPVAEQQAYPEAAPAGPWQGHRNVSVSGRQ